jgi:hypothetical protein
LPKPVVLERAPAPSAVFDLLPLAVLVSGVQVPPMVAPDPTHVSSAAAAMVAFASAISKNEATRKFKLSCLFMAFFSKSANTRRCIRIIAFSILPERRVNRCVKLHHCAGAKIHQFGRRFGVLALACSRSIY